jgi:uncharacterized protein YebE (UPF0316 family)
MAWYIPVLIFSARIVDVSLGTIRMMLVVAGHRWISAFLGFFEVIIWVLAVGWAIRYLDHILALLAYAGGFSTGVFMGMLIESKLAFGLRMIRVINPNAEVDVAAGLRQEGYRVTRIEGSGMSGPVEVAFTVVRRRSLDHARDIIRRLAPSAFMTVERVDRATGELEAASLRRPGAQSRGLLRK